MGQAIATSDADLLEASRRGEHHAFGTIVERYQDVVSAVSYSRTRDHAMSEDVAQETFLAAWRQLDQLRDASRLRSWLCGIARNLAAKAKKRTARETTLDDPTLAASDNPFDAVSEAQAEHLVGEALARVPETYRDVMVLYYREQRPIREVARMLGLGEAAALQRLARGRQYLADGVGSLVERSLRALPKKSLVATVVAALPLIATSRVDAQPHGGSMFAKIAIASVLFAAAGTTAYVVKGRPSAATSSTSASTTTTPKPTAAIPDRDHGGVVRAPTMPAMPALHAGTAPTLEAARVIPDATIAELQLAIGPSRGPANAPVVITVFTDMQCQFCAKALGTLDELFDDYPSSLRVVVKQMPVHTTAQLAAEASFAANAQGKFWELHDLMLANQDSLDRDGLLELGQQAGLDVAALRTALDTHAHANDLARDVAAAKQVGVEGTPTFVINGRVVVGALPVAELRKTIDAALADRS